MIHKMKNCKIIFMGFLPVILMGSNHVHSYRTIPSDNVVVVTVL